MQNDINPPEKSSARRAVLYIFVDNDDKITKKREFIVFLSYCNFAESVL